MKCMSLMVLALCGAAYAQTFEVASIRPAAPPAMIKGGGMVFRMGKTGGPGTPDPTRVSYDNMSLAALVAEAYNMKRYQVAGPNWIDTERFDIKIKVAEGTSKEDYRVMLQNLLAERFKLTVHTDKKELPVYDLVVGKGGSKLKEAVDKPQTAEESAALESKSSEYKAGMDAGKATLAIGGGGKPPAGAMSFNNNGGQTTMKFDKASMADFATRLSGMLNRPVTDSTGLSGKYDIALSFSPQSLGMQPGMGMGMGGGGGSMIVMNRVSGGPAGGDSGGPGPAAAPDPDSGPTLFGAVQDQLGLKLESKKGMVDTIVIDHLEKTPTEN